MANPNTKELDAIFLRLNLLLAIKYTFACPSPKFPIINSMAGTKSTSVYIPLPVGPRVLAMMIEAGMVKRKATIFAVNILKTFFEKFKSLAFSY